MERIYYLTAMNAFIKCFKCYFFSLVGLHSLFIYLDDAQLMDASGPFSGRHGCPTYVCPEMLQPGSYSGRAADLWSLGVIIYTLLVGHYPFLGTSTQNLFSRIRNGYSAYHSWLGLSLGLC